MIVAGYADLAMSRVQYPRLGDADEKDDGKQREPSGTNRRRSNPARRTTSPQPIATAGDVNRS